jgi:hypothetical protein
LYSENKRFIQKKTGQTVTAQPKGVGMANWMNIKDDRWKSASLITLSAVWAAASTVQRFMGLFFSAGNERKTGIFCT